MSTAKPNINVLFHMTSKAGLEAETRALVTEMTEVTRREPGSITYRFHQQRDDPREWVLYEQWRDREALSVHIENMRQHFGDPPEGARLPARLHVLTESYRVVFYDVVA